MFPLRPGYITSYLSLFMLINILLSLFLEMIEKPNYTSNKCGPSWSSLAFHKFPSRLKQAVSISGQLPDVSKMLDKEDFTIMKRAIFATQRQCQPPICTHNMLEDNSDPILNCVRRIGLFNSSADRVKVCQLSVVHKWPKPQKMIILTSLNSYCPSCAYCCKAKAS